MRQKTIFFLRKKYGRISGELRRQLEFFPPKNAQEKKNLASLQPLRRTLSTLGPKIYNRLRGSVTVALNNSEK